MGASLNWHEYNIIYIYIYIVLATKIFKLWESIMTESFYFVSTKARCRFFVLYSQVAYHSISWKSGENHWKVCQFREQKLLPAGNTQKHVLLRATSNLIPKKFRLTDFKFLLSHDIKGRFNISDLKLKDSKKFRLTCTFYYFMRKYIN